MPATLWKLPNGRHADGGNLYLEVKSESARSWQFIFKSPTRNEERTMGLRSPRNVSLARARKKAAELRETVADGIDPRNAREEKKQHAKLMAARNLTFLQCAQRYLDSRKGKFRNSAHQQQWHSTFYTTRREDATRAALEKQYREQVGEVLQSDKPLTKEQREFLVELLDNPTKKKPNRRTVKPEDEAKHLAVYIYQRLLRLAAEQASAQSTASRHLVTSASAARISSLSPVRRRSA